MNNNIINLLIIFFIIIIFYYLYDLYFTIYEPMSNCDKTTDYLKQDLNKFENKTEDNTKRLNKLEEDIKIINNNIEKNKEYIDNQQEQIKSLSEAMIDKNKAKVPKTTNEIPDDLDNIE